MSKKLMILGASILQLPAIIEAKKMGHTVVTVDMNPNAIGMKYADFNEVVSTTDVEAVFEKAIKYNIDGIMTLASDMPMQTVSYVSNKLHLNSVSEDTALITTNKAEMRKKLEKDSIAIPEFYIVNDLSSCIQAVNKIKNDVILKPCDNSGSRGIYHLSKAVSKEEVEHAYNYTKAFSKQGLILVEELMQGKEVSVETITIDGECHVIQITDKETTMSPHFVELGHIQPSRLPQSIINDIIDLTKKANKSLGISVGPSHTEIIVTEQGPKIVEVGARLGGDNITTHLVPLSTGVNMVRACINIALNEPCNIFKTKNMHSRIQYITTGNGIIKNINGIDKVKKISGVVEVQIFRTIGDSVTTVKNSSDRIGYFIIEGENVESVDEVCQLALQQIEILVV